MPTTQAAIPRIITAVDTPTNEGGGVDVAGVTTYKPAMRSIFWGLPVVVSLACLGCAPAKAAKVEDPNWRPTSMPVDKTRDSRVPQWVDVPAGSDLVAPEDIQPEVAAPKGAEKGDPKRAPKDDAATGDKAEATPAGDKAEDKDEGAPAEGTGEAAPEDKGEAPPTEEEGEAPPTEDKG